MLDKDTQTQKASGSALAVQSGRDTYVGMQYGDVKDLVVLLLENNFPRLRAEAVEESRKYVDEFGEKLIEKLADKFEGDDYSFLSKPSFQASVNDGVMYAARKTSEADIDLISDLIVEKINNRNDSIVDIISTEAIAILPRINKSIIAFLAFHHFIRHCSVLPARYRELRSKFFYNSMSARVIDYDDIEAIDKDYIEYLGLVMSGKHYTKKLYELMEYNSGLKHPKDDYDKELESGNYYYDNYKLMSKHMLKFGVESLKEWDDMPMNKIASKIAMSYLNVNNLYCVESFILKNRA